MKFVIEKISENSISLMRRAGYVFQREHGGEESYVRVLARSGFPRFHCYVKIENGRFMGSIHLDQKKETYGKDTRHHGEYDDDGALRVEIERIRSILGTITFLA